MPKHAATDEKCTAHSSAAHAVAPCTCHAPYAFGAYLFQDPIAALLRINYCPVKENDAVASFGYFLFLWFVAVWFSHYVETPCVIALRSATEKCLNACFRRVPRGKGAGKPTGKDLNV